MVKVRPITLREYFPNTVILYNWLDKIPKDILKYNIYKFLIRSKYSKIITF